MTQITFPDAIEKSNLILSQIDNKQMDEEAAFQNTLELLGSTASTRGLFVSLLTGDWKFKDNIPESIVRACSNSPDTVNEVLTKNLVMSSCMELTHLESNDQTSAKGSKQVQRRVIYIISKLNSKSLKEEIQSMRDSIEAKLRNEVESDKYSYLAFLVKWKYSDKQLENANESISKALGMFN